MVNKPIVLMILDGWGSRSEIKNNAVLLADPKNFQELRDKYPATLLDCCGQEVGLPDGQMGNSEVGHLNLGTGRIVYQEISRITKAIDDNSFFSNKELLTAINKAKENKGAVHLMGLLSDGGVHSHLDHLFALLKMCKDNGVSKVFIHGFLDGRDVAPKSALQYVSTIEKEIKKIGVGKIATLSGRAYGMDRDTRWERVEPSYKAIVMGQGNKAVSSFAAITNSYEERITDEFVEPVVIVDEKGLAIGTVNDGDSMIFFNFRADRAREITRAFVNEEFDHFERKVSPQIFFTCMTHYDTTIDAQVAFPPQNLNHTLGEILSKNGLKQLRIAETEKYAHVTFFFNGGVEEPYPGEKRILIPSPRVETYNMKPEMSAYEITAKVKEEISKDIYDVIILNYANPDMVGHTGVLDAAIKAVKVVDECLKEVVDLVLAKDGTVIITADHGNCETMACPITGDPYTAHTLEKVPFILVNDRYKDAILHNGGSLRDVAPTILHLLEIGKPVEMTGKNLVRMV
ncbi:MAG TPA: 2,3-bisphosphoglycerate-independent phosphoglycerate mutase [Syntrophomonadaceae bacterium]|nr:2,3-bisphosphoglycerate-independent phosphoglycerate mutase [Syntrophomonadaceae bacterium]